MIVWACVIVWDDLEAGCDAGRRPASLRHAPLDGSCFPYLIPDARYEKVR